MTKTLHMMCSLPRSGSTLLSNILCQNPNFHATHTSGLLDVLFGVRNHWDTLIEHKAHPMPVAKLNVLRSIINGYYADIKKPIIFDKSRGWTSQLEFIETLLGRKAKVLVCVRPIPEILASLEKLHRETSKTKQPPGEKDNYFQFQTQEGRCEYWLRKDQVLGLAFSRIQDAMQRGFRDRLYFIPFNKLTSEPTQIMKGVYDFLEQPYYEHDFKNVEQVTTENDELHGYEGLHTIRPEVKFVPSDAGKILGEHLVKKYEGIRL